MTFDSSKYTNNTPEEVTLKVRDDEFQIKIRKMPWALKNQKVSLAIKWDADGNSHFDGDYYIRECLKYMIVEAPWGQTTDMFLLSIHDDEFGAVLQSLVPSAFSGKTSQVAEVSKKSP